MAGRAASELTSPGGPSWASRLLDWLYRAEAGLAVTAFACIVAALFGDLIGREFFGKGIFIANRFAVYCMVLVAFLGFALAVAWQAHLGIEIAEKLTPASWDAAMKRVSDVVAAAACIFLAYWSWRFVAGSYWDGARGQGFDILLWPVQSVIVWCFLSSALRHGLFALHPGLRDARAVR